MFDTYIGANADQLAICQYQASGVGTVDDNSENIGVSCYPSYNCRSDWTVCLQEPALLANNLVDESGEFTEAYPPTADDICGEITGLSGYGTATGLGGWIKGEGDLRCGWGATYGHVDPDADDGLPYTEVYENIASEYDCCILAMGYETSDVEEGGAAIRFQLHDGVCNIDREQMVNKYF